MQVIPVMGPQPGNVVRVKEEGGLVSGDAFARSYANDAPTKEGAFGLILQLFLLELVVDRVRVSDRSLDVNIQFPDSGDGRDVTNDIRCIALRQVYEGGRQELIGGVSLFRN